MGNSNVLAGNHPQDPGDSNNNTCSNFLAHQVNTCPPAALSQTVPSSHLGPILNVLAGISEEQCKQLAATMGNLSKLPSENPNCFYNAAGRFHTSHTPSDLATRKMIGWDKQNGGLYYMSPLTKGPVSCHVTHTSIIWHHRLGHPSSTRLHPTPSPTPAQIHLADPTTPTQSHLPDPTPLLQTHLPGPTPPPGSPIPTSSLPHLDIGPMFSPCPLVPSSCWDSFSSNPTVPTYAIPHLLLTEFLLIRLMPRTHHLHDTPLIRRTHCVGKMIILWASLLRTCEPTNYAQVASYTHWQLAMKAELDALQLNRTWMLVPLPPGHKPIGCKWVYKIKYNSDSSIECYNARLVAKGYTQIEGIDYSETFSPTVKITTLRYLLSIATARNWFIHQLDVQNAFLHGDLQEEVYMVPPNRHLIIGVLIYVDDILITGNNRQEMDHLKSFILKQFRIKDLSDLKYFLGIEFSRSKKGLFMSQRKYSLDILQDAELTGARPKKFPVEQNVKLKPTDGDLLNNLKRYRDFESVHAPTENHIWRPHFARLVKFCFPGYEQPSVESLLQFRSCRLSNNKTINNRLLCFSRNSLVPWKSKKQSTVARSFAEAEYRAMTVTCLEITWLCYILQDLRVTQKGPAFAL
ncbi:RmlC-like cupins superfamily protein [Prunus dulcis]|uniref:RmlC-like cupins superfamily protein n=1 Tax=Prunus dulcis TaxID=3755 RepID=A0A4Y1RDR4_PRUDU|nr:RmlC-like cupins superfamily protein [Prunus dulcis]